MHVEMLASFRGGGPKTLPGGAILPRACADQCNNRYVSNWRLACFLHGSSRRPCLELAQAFSCVALAWHLAGCPPQVARGRYRLEVVLGGPRHDGLDRKRCARCRRGQAGCRQGIPDPSWHVRIEVCLTGSRMERLPSMLDAPAWGRSTAAVGAGPLPATEGASVAPRQRSVARARTT